MKKGRGRGNKGTEGLRAENKDSRQPRPLLACHCVIPTYLVSAMVAKTKALTKKCRSKYFYVAFLIK